MQEGQLRAAMQLVVASMRAFPFVLGALCLASGIQQAFAYGAIAVGRSVNGRGDIIGYSHNQPTPELAKQVALSNCQHDATACAIVTEFSEMCVIMYGNHISRKMYYEFYQGPSKVSYAQQDAARVVNRRCESTVPGSHCFHIVSECDTKQGTQEQIAIKERTELAHKEAAEREQRKAIAQKDCPREPTIVGGPWFSSTYKIGAMDAARNAVTADFDRVFCVKSVEYLSDAPNPFGGKAARARFIVYDRDYKLVSQIRDFPY